MKKIIMLILLCFMLAQINCFAQDSLTNLKEVKLHSKAVVTTDSGIQKGYLWQITDSVIILSDKKKFMENNISAYSHLIPAENISMLTVRNKRFPWGEMAAGTILGFVLTAGIWENEDVDQDGHLSFWELLFGAIDGLSSQGRARRRTAMWVGIGGGVAGLLAGSLSGRKLTISFPIGNRRNVLKDNHFNIQQFIH